MSAKETILSNFGIVSYLYMVICFSAFTNNSIACDAEVDSAEGTYFHIVLNHHAAAGLKLHEAFFTALEVACVTTDDGTTLNNDVITNYNMVID